MPAEPDTAYFYWNKGLLIAEKNIKNRSLSVQELISFKRKSGRALNGIANYFKIKGNIELSSHFFHKSLQTFEEIRDTSGITKEFLGLGILYTDIGELNKAL
ncbi:MAG TPA: hypothetical protein PLU73_08405, partial [Bacteroidia bacterium]|nr:hypothetical protein [Bacteroidia bacterium]